MKKIVLFDMDGTLTPAREKMTNVMCRKLEHLQRNGFEIGIVTGSDMDYLKQQCDILFGFSPVDFTKIHYLPCNGTKYYMYQSQKFVAKYELDMKEEIGQENYEKIIKIILSMQSMIANTYLEMPLTGNFVSYRGSMLNYCPIGRAAKANDRIRWSRFERRHETRKKIYSILRQAFNQADMENVVIKLGGETSFDIYPEGWDKTYAFTNFSNYDSIYFVGDKCDKASGNDYEAYVKAGKNGYVTSGPAETMRIIDEIINNDN